MMRPTTLSVSAGSRTSISSSRSLSPNLSPRRGLLCPSPPPSPSLPSFARKAVSRSRRSKGSRFPGSPSCHRLVISVVVVGLVTYILLRSFISEYHSSAEGIYDLEHTVDLPDEPSAIIVADAKGRKKWTVWIPQDAEFPLSPPEYAEICSQAGQVQKEFSHGLFGRRGYYYDDPSFVDVKTVYDEDMLHLEDKSMAETLGNADPRPVCDRSLTFALETDDAGMGPSLLALWLSYGLAKREKRAFFIDDTRWPYGNFSSFFRSLPSTSCKPPSSNYRLPCPRTASHLIISAATFPYVFGSAFHKEFMDTSKPIDQQHHRIFELIRTGYEALFHIADPGDAVYMHERTTGKIFQDIKNGGGTAVGLHVRHGDLHPWQVEFESDYIPLDEYMSAVRQILIDKYEHDDEAEHEHKPTTHLHNAHGHNDLAHLTPFSTFARPKADDSHNDLIKREHILRRHSPPGFAASQVLLASDDPAVFAAPEVSRTIRAQDRIVLASKTELEAAHTAATPGARRPWLDKLHGWEGGFFAKAFFGMGTGDVATRDPPQRAKLVGRNTHSQEHEFLERALAAAKRGERGFGASTKSLRHVHGSETVSPEAMKMRELVGRGYILDLAMLGKSDAVVCAVSSAACRILGVMLGWDKVIGEQWVNVDDPKKFGWQGVVV